MDAFERIQILEEFFVRWMVGKGIGLIAQEMISNGLNSEDVRKCEQIFSKWASAKRPKVRDLFL